MAQDPNEKHEILTALTNFSCENVQGTADKSRTSRHSRWTRHETLVLIEGKKAAEERVRKGRRSVLDPLEPKWDSVSSYCKKHGVDRGPVQCRKRWSNLAGDFRKIKTWEEMESSVEEERESFWMMRNELKKENRLPGYFDKEVFDVLNGRAYNTSTNQMAMVSVPSQPNDEEDEATVMEDDDEDGEIPISDSGCQADEALIFNSEHTVQEERVKIPYKDNTVHSPMPISEKRYHPFHHVSANQGCIYTSGVAEGNQPGYQFWPGSTSNEGGKKRRFTTNETKDANFEERLINVLEQNSVMLSLHIESHNKNLQLDRDQSKKHADNLVGALKKATDALVRIADKLTKDS